MSKVYKPPKPPPPVVQAIRLRALWLSFWVALEVYCGFGLIQNLLLRFSVEWQLFSWLGGFVVAFMCIFWICLKARTTRYEMDRVSVRLRQGILTRVADAFDMVDIAHVRLKRTALDQAFGLARLEIRSKNKEVSKVELCGVSPEWAHQAFEFINVQSTDDYLEYLRRKDEEY